LNPRGDWLWRPPHTGVPENEVSAKPNRRPPKPATALNGVEKNLIPKSLAGSAPQVSADFGYPRMRRSPVGLVRRVAHKS